MTDLVFAIFGHRSPACWELVLARSALSARLEGRSGWRRVVGNRSEVIMIKRLTLWHARPQVNIEEALAHWRTGHAELVRAVPGLRRYVQNHCVTGPVGDAGAERPYAGLGEIWFDDMAAAEAAMATPEWRTVIADAATFMDTDHIAAAWAEEHVFET
jgi:uncharacterized protein (TIGR02118 family)